MYCRRDKKTNHQKKSMAVQFYTVNALPADVIASSNSMTDGTTDPDMNEYADEMD